MIKYINNPSEAMQEYIFYTFPNLLRYVHNPSEDILEAAEEYVNNLTRKEQLESQELMDYLGVPIKDNTWTKLLKALHVKE